MKKTAWLWMLAILAGLLTGCSHLKPVADTHPPAYEDAGERGILDSLAQGFWPSIPH